MVVNIDIQRKKGVPGLSTNLLIRRRFRKKSTWYVICRTVRVVVARYQPAARGVPPLKVKGEEMKKSILVALVLSTLVWMAACGGGGGSSSGESGTLSVSLTDASGSYRAVYVTIDEVQVHLGGSENSPNNWKSVEMPEGPITLNLLELVNGVRRNLGVVKLDAGRYTQMRLIIGTEAQKNLDGTAAHPHANYVIDTEDPPNTHELKIPSGQQTGIKIVNGFDINGGQTTELLLDFDAAHSVVQAGASGNWLLKPTIRVRELPECATITGQVTDSVGEPFPGALVSVQNFDEGAGDPADQVTVAAASITDSDGFYQLFVAPGAYNLVAYALDGRVGFSRIHAGQETVPIDIELNDIAEGVGAISGDVSIIGGTDDQYATLSFRRDVSDADGTNVIEINSINVLNSFGFSVNLPAGPGYTIVASSIGYESEVYSDIQVDDDSNVPQDISIPTPAPVE